LRIAGVSYQACHGRAYSRFIALPDICRGVLAGASTPSLAHAAEENIKGVY